jgi:hypothetical protein
MSECTVRHLLDFGAVAADSGGTLRAAYEFLAGTLSARVTLFCAALAVCTALALYVAARIRQESLAAL